jgi:hypothetical protein
MNQSMTTDKEGQESRQVDAMQSKKDEGNRHRQESRQANEIQSRKDERNRH